MYLIFALHNFISARLLHWPFIQKLHLLQMLSKREVMQCDCGKTLELLWSSTLLKQNSYAIDTVSV